MSSSWLSSLNRVAPLRVMLVVGALVGSTAVSRADQLAYMVTGPGEFGLLDIGTDVFSPLGLTGQTLAGLGESGGNLYGTSFAGANPGTLYRVNTANGQLTAVGSSGIDYWDFGSTTSGLYADGLVNGVWNLYRINANTGAATLLGATVPEAADALGMSDNSSTLYFATGENLYTLNTTTGAGTLIGPDNARIGALLQYGTTLYGGVNGAPVSLGVVNTSNGSIAPGATLTGTTGTYWGLAADPVPSSVPDRLPAWMAALALFGLVASGTRLQPRQT